LPVWTKGAPSPRTTLIHNTARNRYAIRHDDWLLIDNTSGGVSRVPDWFNEKFSYPDNPHPGELYNLADDLAQRSNLWAEHPERIEELRQKLNEIRRSGQVR
jgi:arylsulfatase A